MQILFKNQSNYDYVKLLYELIIMIREGKWFILD